MTAIGIIEDVLGAHARQIGRDFDAYRNHAYRVANFAFALAPDDPDARDGIAVAAAFHDIGIWTHGTFDYLEPSVLVCTRYLTQSRRAEWTPEVSAMIREHHKVTRWRGDASWLVEPFRKGDWIDVTRGLVSHGVPRDVRARVFAEWPSLGFRRRLVQLTVERFRRHPLSPLPMLRL